MSTETLECDGRVQPPAAPNPLDQAWNEVRCRSVVLTRRGPQDAAFLRHVWRQRSFMSDFYPFASPLPADDAHLAQLLQREQAAPLHRSLHAHWVIRTPQFEPAGLLSLADISPAHRRAELLVGLCGARSFGLATAAVLLAADYAFRFRRLHKIYAFVAEGNGKSLVAQRNLGFVVEGLLKDHWFLATESRFVSVHQTAFFAEQDVTPRSQALRARLLGPYRP